MKFLIEVAVVLAIAAVYAAIFAIVYPRVTIDAGLATLFAVAGFLTFGIAAFLLHLVRDRFKKREP